MLAVRCHSGRGRARGARPTIQSRRYERFLRTVEMRPLQHARRRIAPTGGGAVCRAAGVRARAASETQDKPAERTGKPPTPATPAPNAATAVRRARVLAASRAPLPAQRGRPPRAHRRRHGRQARACLGASRVSDAPRAAHAPRRTKRCLRWSAAALCQAPRRSGRCERSSGHGLVAAARPATT